MAEDEEKSAANPITKKNMRGRKKTPAAPAPDLKESPTTASSPNKPKRARSARPFPAGPFDEALTFAKEIYNLGSGTPVRRLTLFDHLQRTPDSSTSRMLVTNASKYGLVKGSYASEQLELTLDGKKVCDDNTSPREAARLKAKLAISDIAPFQALYDKFTNAKLPPRAALIDSMKEAGTDPDHLEEGVDTFIVNLKFVGLLQNLSGADRVVTVEHLLDTLPGTLPTSASSSIPPAIVDGQNLMTQEQAAFESTCFYITAIGSTDSDQRKHSNLFLENIVEPAIQTVGLKVIRADQIDKPGMITRQIIEYLFRSRLVVADLSFSNANVFYELALRHAIRLPIVQIIRHGDPIPFDINQMRTVTIDNRDIYTLLPNVELYKSEIASQARRALEAGVEVDTPVSMYFPQARLTI
ncbi:hypothetical protein [Acetobacter sp.]|jgi:hypothetical protein|uniref:hypothetical protein n=1 Tax=Acetobacter sp. TaxID=440 RepID=UPI0025C25222|nr:hypothetical protein [Acetobacter sp.]MCH4092611.1 hypothetical protein [Acetobacter sp.]MCI1299745.1 hypothetical protein [Acetobacter sp.]MCI1315375.1 hypothetical protein [Acetobacter sp.]